jgi:hypothetical protein
VTDRWAVGAALAILGMGGTLLTLYVLSLLMEALKRFAPYDPEREK